MKMLPFVCLVTAILVSVLGGVQGNGLHHIVNGVKARPCEFPHLVFIYTSKDGKHFGCGGSLIDDRHVLTAAHCVHGDVKSVLVLMGSVDKMTMPIRIPVSHFTKHKLFKQLKQTVVNDVAVLTLSKSVRFSPCIKPIRMAVPGERFVGECTIAGWGRTTYNSPGSHKLLRADIPLMDDQTCRNRLPLVFSQHICGGSGRFNDKTVCKGDSGGPLMCKSATDGVRVLAGVVSYGWKCNTGLGVFAKVSYFLPWINAATRS